MDDNIKIVGPEKVAFSIELAGVGSRFLALAIDLLVLTLSYPGGQCGPAGSV